MNEPKPTVAPASRADPREARLEREAAALRENLRRRKQQARARAEPSAPAPSPAPPDADGG